MKILSLLLLLVASGSTAQADSSVPDLHLTVTKSTKKNLRTSVRSNIENVRAGVMTVWYSIELDNRSPEALRDVLVKWTIFLRPMDAALDAVETVEGERKVSLAMGQRVAIQIKPLTLKVWKSTTTLSSDFDDFVVTEQDQDRIEGHAVEVRQGDKVIATEVQPESVVQRLKALKANQSRAAK